jgi:hypothetical protein
MLPACLVTEKVILFPRPWVEKKATTKIKDSLLAIYTVCWRKHARKLNHLNQLHHLYILKLWMNVDDVHPKSCSWNAKMVIIKFFFDYLPNNEKQIRVEKPFRTEVEYWTVTWPRGVAHRNFDGTPLIFALSSVWRKQNTNYWIKLGWPKSQWRVPRPNLTNRQQTELR